MPLEPEVVLEFTTDYKYLGLQYYAGDEIEMYEKEAEHLLNLGVARKKASYGDR